MQTQDLKAFTRFLYHAAWTYVKVASTVSSQGCQLSYFSYACVCKKVKTTLNGLYCAANLDHKRWGVFVCFVFLWTGSKKKTLNYGVSLNKDCFFCKHFTV